jgi:hypothetical protein
LKFLRRLTLANLLAATALLASICASGCDRQGAQPTPQAAVQPSRPRLSATEEFDLRSKCADLGDKMRPGYGIVGAALSSDVLTHYNPDTNRCYVQFTATKNFNYKSSSVPTNYRTVGIYDGQTREMLVFADQEGDKSYGTIYTAKSTDDQYTTYDKASDEIDKLMHGGDDAP